MSTRLKAFVSTLVLTVVWFLSMVHSRYAIVPYMPNKMTSDVPAYLAWSVASVLGLLAPFLLVATVALVHIVYDESYRYFDDSEDDESEL